VEECPGCSGPYEPWRFCVECGRWLTVQVTPTGWRGRCRGCGGVLESSHGAALPPDNGDHREPRRRAYPRTL